MQPFLESLRQSVVAEIRPEFEAREQKLKEAYAHEREKLTSDFNARLAIQQSEVNRLKSINDKIELQLSYQITQGNFENKI